MFFYRSQTLQMRWVLICLLSTACDGDFRDERGRGEEGSEDSAIEPLLERMGSNLEAVAGSKFAANLDVLCRLSPRRQTFKMNTPNAVREFVVYSPKRDCKAKAPAILVFHGGYGTAQNTEDVTPFEAEARKVGSLVIYPNGINKEWNDGRISDEGEPISTTDDVGFIRSLIDLLASTQKVDMKRIYATGHSNGGSMTLRLACELSDKIAAFASNAASLAEGLKDRCALTRPVPVMMVNGTADTFMPYEGGSGKTIVLQKDQQKNLGDRLSVEDSVALFRAKNSCNLAATVSDIPNLDKRDGTTSKRLVYRGCKASVEVQLIKVEGGGHTWPGNKNSRFPLMGTGNLSMDFNMSVEAMTFFKRFSLP